MLDAAVLLEAGWDDLCDRIAFVDAPRAERLRRVEASRGWSEETLEARERSQWPVDEKRRRADWIIDNDGPLGRLGREVDRLLGRLRADSVAGGVARPRPWIYVKPPESRLPGRPRLGPGRHLEARRDQHFGLFEENGPDGQRDSPPPGAVRHFPDSQDEQHVGGLRPAGGRRRDGRRVRPAAALRRRSVGAGRHAGPEPARDRKDREPFREEGPADREPIRYLRDRGPSASRSASAPSASRSASASSASR